MSEIKAGVLLTLKDAFSHEMTKATNAGKTFGTGLLDVSSKVDKALSGVAGTLASIGISIGAAATINKTIDFEDKLVRLGTVANATDAEIQQMKKNIFESASLDDIKVNPDGIVDAMDIIMTKTGNITFAKDNIENIGRAMQGMNANGSEIGSMMAEFDKLGHSAKEVTNLLDAMYVQGNKGAFTAAAFAKNGSAIIAAYSNIGTSSKDIEKANAAMQILTMGTKDPTAAVTVLENVMQELADPSKQNALRKMGINVRDIETGAFRDLTEILPEIVAKGKEFGNLDMFGAVFGGTSMKALQAFDVYGDKLNDFLDLGDTSNALAEASARNAATLKSNITNLQTAFTSITNSALDKPLRASTDILNEMAKHPGTIKAVFTALIAGIAGVAALKGIGSVVNLVSGLKSLKSGKVSIGADSSGGNGMPVYITNWGGTPSASLPQSSGNLSKPNSSTGRTPTGKKNNRKTAGGKRSRTPQKKPVGKTPTGKKAGTPLGKSGLSGKQMGGLGAGAAVTAALFAVPDMLSEINDVNANEDLTKKEKNTAKGGAIGEAIGKIGGAAGGAIAGAAIGSVVPVVGTAIGALVGGAIGYIGGKLGRKAGEAIGAAVTKDEIPQSVSEAVSEQNTPMYDSTLPSSIQDKLNTMSPLPTAAFKTELSGTAQMDVNINLSGERPTASVSFPHNTVNGMRFQTGNTGVARSMF